MTEPKNLWMIFTADSDSVCEGSNPSPAAMMTTGNCIYAVPRAPILKFVFALFVVLPDLVPVPGGLCGAVQAPEEVFHGGGPEAGSVMTG